jgi:hypothetical protein
MIQLPLRFRGPKDQYLNRGFGRQLEARTLQALPEQFPAPDRLAWKEKQMASQNDSAG